MNDQSSLLGATLAAVTANAADTVVAAIVPDEAVSDQIFLRDHIREVEIGCFEEEFGVTQALRFNVVLDVPRFTLETSDEEGAVVSYDVIVEAIEALCTGERLSLVETFAERLAAILLQNHRIARTWIRLEKLDRVHGSLGVEIVRKQANPA